MKKPIVIIVFLLIGYSILFPQDDFTFLDLNEFGGKVIPTSLLSKISIHLENAPFETALQTISEKSQVKLNYGRNQIPLEKKVSIHEDNVYAMEALLTVLKNTGTMLKITQQGQLAIVPAEDSNRDKSAGFKGTIKGTVKDSLTGEPLPFANILIKGTSIGAASDADGEYHILKVPPGRYTLIVKYIGYKEASVPITVKAGGSITQNIELQYVAIKGEMIEITAQAEGQIEAINQQLSARTIKNVVAADRIQEIPDVNAAESVARLPGISIIRSGGEGQQVDPAGV